MAGKPNVVSFDDTDEDDFASNKRASVAVTDNRARVASSGSQRARPQSMVSPKSSSDSMRKDSKGDSGTLSKFKLFGAKKPEPIKSKIQIGTPSNFQHLAGHAAAGPPASPTGAQAALLATFQQEGSGIENSSRHSKISKESLASISTSNSDGIDLTADMLQSDPKAFTKLTKKKIDELISGAYFLMHTKNGLHQKFISCSNDLSRLHLWSNGTEKEEGSAPADALNFGEILGIKLGYGTPTFKETGIEGRNVLAFSLVLNSNRSLDLEAFTPEDRDFWVESFNGLISFFKAQPIPQPARAGGTAAGGTGAGPVSSI